MQEFAIAPIDFIILGLFVVVLSLYLYPAINKKLKKNINTINAKELFQKMKRDEDFFIIDLRRQEEFNGIMGHIKGSTNIPITELFEKITHKKQALQKMLDTSIIILGFKEGSEVYAGYNLLKNAGFVDIYLLNNGISGWVKGGFPVEVTNRSL